MHRIEIKFSAINSNSESDYEKFRFKQHIFEIFSMKPLNIYVKNITVKI